MSITTTTPLTQIINIINEQEGYKINNMLTTKKAFSKDSKENLYYTCTICYNCIYHSSESESMILTKKCQAEFVTAMKQTILESWAKIETIRAEELSE